ncbi:hypothetical protein BGZ54_005162 [Gamsiella multidivaricata]|nr:hypothetical protein BGZ54_005162 [Gamsiella multidivaricata]
MALNDNTPSGPLEPLLQPKVLRRLGEHLGRTDLLAGLRVCKTWHTAFEPFLWHTLALQNQPCNFTPRQATPTLLLRNRHHIRRLHEVGSNSLLKFLAFSTQPPTIQLTNISVSILSPEILMITHHCIDTLASFSCRSNRLRKDHQTQSLWCRQLFSILEMASALTELAIGPLILLDSPNDVFAKVCKNLKRLELDRVKVADRDLYDESIAVEAVSFKPFPALETLILIWNDFPPQCQLELIRKSPNLKSVTWRRGTQQLAQSWLSGTLAMPIFLTSLDIGHSYINDESIARILAMAPNLVTLNARSTPFAAKSGQYLLENQGPKMVELDVMDCVDLSAGIVQVMLTSMSKLKKFCAPRVNAADVAFFLKRSLSAGWSPEEIPVQVETDKSSPAPGSSVVQPRVPTGSWTCLDMEELELTIDGSGGFEDQDFAEVRSLVFEQLGRLTRLQVLVLSEKVQEGDEEKRLLNFTLQCGLSKLSGLKRLTELDICSLQVNIGREEVEWMKKEWPRLIDAKGKLKCKVDIEDKFLRRSFT